MSDSTILLSRQQKIHVGIMRPISMPNSIVESKSICRSA